MWTFEPKLFKEILVDSVLSALSYILALGVEIIPVVLAGHLKYSSDSYVAAIGTGYLLQSYMAYGVWGCNIGFMINIGKLRAIKNYKMIRTTYKFHGLAVLWLSGLFYIYQIILYVITPGNYEPVMAIGLKQFYSLGSISMILCFYNDRNRQLFLGFGLYNQVFLMEVLSVALSTYLSYLFTFTWDL